MRKWNVRAWWVHARNKKHNFVVKIYKQSNCTEKIKGMIRKRNEYVIYTNDIK